MSPDQAQRLISLAATAQTLRTGAANLYVPAIREARAEVAEAQSQAALPEGSGQQLDYRA